MDIKKWALDLKQQSTRCTVVAGPEQTDPLLMQKPTGSISLQMGTRPAIDGLTPDDLLKLQMVISAFLGAAEF